MKQLILEKLFNDKQLSSEEILFISRNLEDSSEISIPYNHSKKSTLEACGLSEKDIDRANLKFKDTIDGEETISQTIERIEKVAYTDKKLMRMLVLQATRAALSQNEVISINGSDPADLEKIPEKIRNIIKQFIEKKKREMDGDSD